MPVNQGLATLSDNLIFWAILAYAVAMLGFAAEAAFGRRGRVGRRTAAPRGVSAPATRVDDIDLAAPEPALVGAASSVAGSIAVSSAGGARRVTGRPGGSSGRGAARSSAGAGAGAADADAADAADTPAADTGAAATIGRIAVAITVLGWALHLGSLVARGYSAHRVPWGNMYEFASAGCLSAVTAYLVLLTRQKVRYLGTFVLLPVVLLLGLAVTVLYASAGPLVPALHSYWLAIHVTAAVISFGVFTVSTAATALYLAAERYQRRLAAGGKVGLSGIARLLPSAEALDRTAYRSVAFGFPIWTFAIIAGAIWAEAAWGRYWGWDPKETWAFVTWVCYAGYLHARSTAGWRGRKAALLGLLAFATFLFNYFGVNIWITGLHSYAGI